MRYRDRAVYADGRDSDLTGREADDRYAPFGPFREVGAELVFLSDVEEQLVGDDQRVGPDRRGPLPDPSGLPRHAGPSRVRRTARAQGRRHGLHVRDRLRARPPSRALPADAPALDAVPHPSTPEDGPVVILHVLRYHEGRVSEDMEIYQGLSARIAVPHGRPHRRVVRRRGHRGGRRPRLGPGPVPRVPVAGRLHGRRPRPGAPGRPGRPPGAGHRRHLHPVAPTHDRPPGGVRPDRRTPRTDRGAP